LPCDLAGRYVTIIRPNTDRLLLSAVATFIDCNSPLIKWDPFDTFLMSIPLGDTMSVDIPLLSEMEAILGENVCNELAVEVVDMPDFCVLELTTITCSPTDDPAHGGVWTFTVRQVALEWRDSAKEFQALVEVILPTPPPPPPSTDPDPVPDPPPLPPAPVPDKFKVPENTPPYF